MVVSSVSALNYSDPKSFVIIHFNSAQCPHQLSSGVETTTNLGSLYIMKESTRHIRSEAGLLSSSISLETQRFFAP
ncbi:hypothetical protein U27_01453 [Candidatus Vecturithrix granuli]|uniref:Uncharacterized protein n=1 Tax=Vecturithrix granuli TaxID=1499967 RepID=A0A081CAE7_VECG1|nr:hypothetical protein U27_01453 [Candidatus Vecturithrix granuli]